MVDELRDLRWAVITSRHRSLRQAAEALNVRQSTLSRCLHNMEHRHGARLFERNNGGTKPTSLGWEFLADARRILEQIDSVFARLKARGKGECGRLTLGAYTSFSTGNLRATLIEYQECFPDIDLSMIDGCRDDLFGDLCAGVIDVIIMTTSHADWDDCRLPLWSERVIIALPEQHVLCTSPIIRWADLKGERLIITERGPAPEFEQLIIAKLGHSSLSRTQRQATGLDRLLSLVSIGRGPLLVLEGATGARYDGVVYREVHDETGPTRLPCAAYWRQENDNPALKPFLDIFRSRYPDFSVTDCG